MWSRVSLLRNESHVDSPCLQLIQCLRLPEHGCVHGCEAESTFQGPGRRLHSLVGSRIQIPINGTPQTLHLGFQDLLLPGSLLQQPLSFRRWRSLLCEYRLANQRVNFTHLHQVKACHSGNKPNAEQGVRIRYSNFLTVLAIRTSQVISNQAPGISELSRGCKGN
jgi:hypothetical protein